MKWFAPCLSLVTFLAVAACDKTDPASGTTGASTEAVKPTGSALPTTPAAATVAANGTAAVADSAVAPAGTVNSGPLPSDTAEMGMVLLERMVDIFEKNKGDCDKIAGELKKYLDANADNFKKLKEFGAKQTPEEKKKFTEKYKTRADASTKRLMANLGTCATNQKIAEAMQSLKID